MSTITLERKSEIVNESIGKKFGKLTVISFVRFSKTRRGANVPKVLVQCTCGNTKEVSLWDVRSGKTASCGTNHVDYEDRTIPAINNIYSHSYRGRAIKNGVEFSITKEQFKSLCESACFYCGVLPDEFSATSGWCNISKRGKIKSGKYISEWKYNGLDRIDPNKGYTLDNVVPCCGICNHAKHTLSYFDFTNWLDRIVQFRSK